MHATVWWRNNDMLVKLSGLRSSTGTAYTNTSTGVSCHLWKVASTASTSNRITTAAVNMPYVTGTNGNYQVAIQSTAATAITSTVRGMTIITVRHSGLDGEWRVYFRGEHRGST